MGLDCGTKSQELNRKAVRKAKMIHLEWSHGPFEMASFEAGTKALRDDVVAATKKGCICDISSKQKVCVFTGPLAKAAHAPP